MHVKREKSSPPFDASRSKTLLQRGPCLGGAFHSNHPYKPRAGVFAHREQDPDKTKKTSRVNLPYFLRTVYIS